MGKFIVIKAEDWEKLKSASKHGLHSLPNIPIIELSTDESIEDSAVCLCLSQSVTRI